MKKEYNLKPCPFCVPYECCGEILQPIEELELCVGVDDYDRREIVTVFVTCRTCDASGPEVVTASIKEITTDVY